VYSNQKEGTTDVADEDIDNSETLDKSSRKAALKSKNSHATTAKLTNGNAAKRKIYQVQRGDTLFSITKKFDGLTIEQIKKANKLKSEKLKVGQTLILG
jgi:membrane-bound lytic murein transglycosylase D